MTTPEEVRKLAEDNQVWHGEIPDGFSDSEESHRQVDAVSAALREYAELLERAERVTRAYEDAVCADKYPIPYLDGLSKAVALMSGTDRKEDDDAKDTENS
jgi:hypothetical protein